MIKLSKLCQERDYREKKGKDLSDHEPIRNRRRTPTTREGMTSVSPGGLLSVS